MKQTTLVLLLPNLLVGVPFGHGGGLDKNGGDYNHKTGEYHSHR